MTLLGLYRLTKGTKISSLRLLLYPIFGLALSGVFRPALFLWDLLIIFFGLLAASYLNDYYDALLQGEENEARRSNRMNVLYGFVPGICAAGALIAFGYSDATKISLVLLWASFALSMMYSLPPVRLKGRHFFGFFAPPIGIYFLFFQGLVLVRYPGQFGWMVAAIVFLFVWYREALHLVDDALVSTEVKKISLSRALWCARAVPMVGIGLGAVCAYFSWIFLLSIVFWFFRARAVWRSSPEAIASGRKTIFSSFWHLEEFAVYAGVGMMKILGFL